MEQQNMRCKKNMVEKEEVNNEKYKQKCEKLFENKR